MHPAHSLPRKKNITHHLTPERASPPATVGHGLTSFLRVGVEHVEPAGPSATDVHLDPQHASSSGFGRLTVQSTTLSAIPFPSLAHARRLCESAQFEFFARPFIATPFSPAQRERQRQFANELAHCSWVACPRPRGLCPVRSEHVDLGPETKHGHRRASPYLVLSPPQQWRLYLSTRQSIERTRRGIAQARPWRVQRHERQHGRRGL